MVVPIIAAVAVIVAVVIIVAWQLLERAGVKIPIVRVGGVELKPWPAKSRSQQKKEGKMVSEAYLGLDATDIEVDK